MRSRQDVLLDLGHVAPSAGGVGKECNGISRNDGLYIMTCQMYKVCRQLKMKFPDHFNTFQYNL